MEYIKDTDYDYIMNKYHDSSKHFDGHARFIRRDELFSVETGMDGEEIKEEILHRDEEMFRCYTADALWFQCRFFPHTAPQYRWTKAARRPKTNWKQTPRASR